MQLKTLRLALVVFALLIVLPMYAFVISPVDKCSWIICSTLNLQEKKSILTFAIQ